MTKAALLIGVLALAAAPLQDDESKSLRAKLRSIRLDVDFKNASLDELVDYVREVAGINVVVNRSKPKLTDARITIKAKGISIQSIFNLVLKPQGIGYKIDDGVLVIVPSEDLQADVRLEIIDVRDLLMPVRDFPGGDITLVEDGLGTTFTAADEAPSKEFPIVDLVKAHTGGKSWDENSRASVQLMNGLLIVRQTDEVIQQIRRILNKLRHYK